MACPKEAIVERGERPVFRWLERGSGEAVLLLHGLIGQMDHWDCVLDGLADRCRSLALSLPFLDEKLQETSIDGIARYVVDFLDALDIGRAVVGGNSLGGHVALELTLRYPERVSGLILTGSSGLMERSFTRALPRRPSTEYVRRELEAVFYDASLVTPEWVEAVRTIVTTPSSARRVLRLARAAKRHNVRDWLGGVAVPTLLIWGREDRVTPPEIAQRFLTLLPDAQLWFLSHCGHAPMLEQPESFSDIVTAWLGETRSRRPTATSPVRDRR